MGNKCNKHGREKGSGDGIWVKVKRIAFGKVKVGHCKFAQ